MKIFNSMTRAKEEFVPIEPGRVRMYSCGPTVYNLFHIGNARPFIIFDMLRNYLEYKGYKVDFVQNFTDVDDKLIRKAEDEGISVDELADKYIKEYFIDADGLGIRRATWHPRATENIDAIIEIIERLVEKGHAYNADGDVYFSAKTFEDYGKLSNQPLSELSAGARVGIEEGKKDAADFALWKKQKAGEISWESPWGRGRPGWHIECSAMANRFLGPSIDIHSGGQDLIFPHHENEIAQSEAANGARFVKYWVHNGYISIDNEKMSKSLGNFITVRDAAKEYGYETIRYFMISAHYRSPINYSPLSMEQAKNGLERLYNCVDNLEFLIEKGGGGAKSELFGELSRYRERFIAAMDDDLNTADALSVLFELVRAANTQTAQNNIAVGELSAILDMICELGCILGILRKEKAGELDSEISALVDLREKARAEKNWAKADEIRDTLKDMGIIIEDTPKGVKWKRQG